MTETITDATAVDGWAAFDKTTSRWGRITMIIAMVIMIAGPATVAAQLGVRPAAVATGVVAVAVTFGALWLIEPLSYFPILGPASMYQAFLLGNISNKLLPSAVVAQSTIGARPETRRGQLAAVLAICGAATIHLASLVIFVGVLGTLALRVIPPDVITSVQVFVLPAVMGGVIVQMVASNPNVRILAIAIGVGLVVQLVLTPLVPIFALIGIGVSVLATVGLALVLPGRKTGEPAAERPAVGNLP